jgi:hypothetical protein
MSSDNIKNTEGFKDIDENKDGKLSLSEIENKVGAGVSQPRGSDPVINVSEQVAEKSYDAKDNASIRAAIENTPLPESLNLGIGQVQDVGHSDGFSPSSAGRAGQGVEQHHR